MAAGEGNGGRVGVGSLVLDRYRLDRQVAAGGMGVLWQATDTVLEGVVALKRVSFAHLGPEQARVTRDRTLREARVSARLRGHPHVVSLYDVRVDEGDVWLVMEYVPSQSLSQLLAGGRTLPATEVARVGAAIADALVAAHALDIRHRDVTPGNVLLGADGTVKLTDFGVAHSTTDVHLTETGAVVGTVAFLSPEVAGGGEATTASDVFTLGATLYAACEGQPPFGRDPNPVRMLHIVSAGQLRPPRNAGPLEPLLLRMLARDQAARPDAATAREHLRHLAATPDTAVITAAPVPAPPHPGRATPGRARRRWLVAALVVLLLAVAGGIVALARNATSGRAQGSPTPTSQGGGDAGVPTLPGAVPTIVMAGPLRTVDACQLVATPALHRFGQAKIVRGTAMFGCGAYISAPGGAMAAVGYEFSGPSSNGSFDGVQTDLGGLRLFQNAPISDSGGTQCSGVVALSDNSAFYATAHPLNGAGKNMDLCGMVKTLEYATAGQLARTGVPPRSSYADAFPLADRQACDLVDDQTLSTVPGLDLRDNYSGPAGWACHWGADKHDSTKTSVSLTFQLAAPADFNTPDDHEPIQLLGGTQAFQTRQSSESTANTCTVSVPRQPNPNPDGTYQVVEVKVTTPASRQQQCAYAATVAASADHSLS